MALKDWKKSGKYLYENEKLKKAIYLVHNPTNKLYWYEIGNIIGESERFKRISTINTFKLKESKTKPQALKFAKSYMRKH